MDSKELYTVKSISVSFSATIPTQPYGNVGVSTQWNLEVHEGVSGEEATRDAYRRIHAQVLEAVQPIAERKVKGMESALASLPKSERDAVIQNLGPISWMQAVAGTAADFASNGKQLNK